MVMTYFYLKVKVKGQDLDHYPAKLLKHCMFLQNVFAFLIEIIISVHNNEDRVLLNIILAI